MIAESVSVYRMSEIATNASHTTDAKSDVLLVISTETHMQAFVCILGISENNTGL